jgi:pimeloyl-ACP methyl ester carboxylesterase
MIKFVQLSAIYFVLFLGAFFFYGFGPNDRKVEVKKAKMGNIELAYYMRGSGEPLVMIMGFRGTMAAWDPGLLEILEKNFTLILFDNRGAGLSTDSEENLTTISQMAEDTVQLIKMLGYKKAHVLGWSMGSRIAEELTIKYPEIVDTLILCSPNPGGKYQAKRKSNAYEKLTSLDLSEEKVLSLIFPDTPEGKKASTSLVSRLTKAIVQGTVPDDLKVSNETIERQVHAVKLWDGSDHSFEALSKITRPALIAAGLDDVLDEPENAKMIACRIPFAWSAFFPGAGHDFLSQDYERFAELVTLFIDTNMSSRSAVPAKGFPAVLRG